jgi:hypothetical protein
MPKRRPGKKRLPIKYPSVPDRDSGPTRYNEPAVPTAEDRVPAIDLEYMGSKADLRLQIERLLLRKETHAAEAWARLGEDARTLLVEMLDDEAIRSREAVLHRLISVLGQLSIKSSVAPLSTLLTARSTNDLTKAYAANALGRIGEPAAVDALAASLNEKDDMVRRQVAMALGRVDRDAVVPHLMKLQTDESIAVAEVAAAALRRWEDKLGQRLGTKKLEKKTGKPRKRKSMPAPER